MNFEEWWQLKHPFKISLPGHLVKIIMEQKEIAKQVWDYCSVNKSNPCDHKFEPRYTKIIKYKPGFANPDIEKIYECDVCIECGKLVR